MQATRSKLIARVTVLIFCVALIYPIGSLDLRAQVSPDTSNPAELYRKAFAGLKDLSPAENKLLNDVRASQSESQINSNQEDYKKLLMRLKPSLDLAKKASKLDRADWKTDDESTQWIDLGGPSKQLMRALMLLARLDIKEERFDEAAKALLSAMALSRHLGQDGVFIVRLIEASTFKMVANFCAQEIPKFPVSVLMEMQKTLSVLPASLTAKETLLAENQYSVKLSKQKGSPYPQDLMDGYLEFYDQVIAFGDLPPDQFENKLKALGESHADNVMVKAILPMLPRMRQQIAVHEANMALLELGLNVLISGEQVVKGTKDLFGESTFEYTLLDNSSFELRSQMMYRGEKVKLRFGR